MGERAASRAAEIAALRAGIELGMTVVDTAEMYGEGATDKLVGEALAGLRDDVFLVSKVYPHNAGRRSMVRSCEASLRRLKTDRLDLYLLHWGGSIPLDETVEAFETLRRAGKIRHWGVSNFDTDDMDALFAAGGIECAANQVLYNVARRGSEFDLLPWMRRRKMPAMAYSPIDHMRLPERSALNEIAHARGVSMVQIALAWVLGEEQVCAIPKAGSVAHVNENRAALDIVLTEAERTAIDAFFSPPRSKQPLAML
jgi:diketogulonate reductase-like aldo/keto reductase